MKVSTLAGTTWKIKNTELTPFPFYPVSIPTRDNVTYTQPLLNCSFSVIQKTLRTGEEYNISAQNKNLLGAYFFYNNIRQCGVAFQDWGIHISSYRINGVSLSSWSEAPTSPISVSFLGDNPTTEQWYDLTITIHNGSYVDNAQLISWFETNAVLVIPSTSTTFVFDTTMIQRIDVYDSDNELRFGTDTSGTTFDSAVIGTTYTIKPTYVEHYTIKNATTTSTKDLVIPLTSSGNVSWTCEDTEASTITITAQIIPTRTTFTWDKYITQVDIYDGSTLIFSQTERDKVFKHDFDSKVYTIKPTLPIGRLIDTVTSTSANDTFVINEDGTISWTAGWDSGTIEITTKKDPSYYKKIPSGTYYWKDNPLTANINIYEEVTFSSNGKLFEAITIAPDSITYGRLTKTVVAQRTSTDKPFVWVDEKYKILSFDDVEFTLPFYQWAYLRSNLRFTSEVEIQLYQCTCENKRVDKTNYLKLLDTITGTMRDSISVTDMSVEIEYPIPTFNYVYIPLFNRYYFVDDISSVVYGVWSVALSVDVLMSYKDTIKTLEAFVDRSQSNYNLKVIDNKLPLEKTETVEVDTVQNQLFVDNFGTYVLQGLQVTPGSAEGNT